MSTHSARLTVLLPSNPMLSSSHPTVLIIFGATGDVVAKKIVPAIFRLFSAGRLPTLFRVVGFSRREQSDEVFQAYIRELVAKKADLKATEEQMAAFAALFSYARGSFDQKEDYVGLAQALGQVDGDWKTCANKLFYLAVPPDLYEPIFHHLADVGLTKECGEDGGWTRILVEKPIGMDQTTSETIDGLLGNLFREEQIYRIEHYLAKEMIRNLLVFRFGNDLFEGMWNHEHIEQIHIRLWEAIGVETRGAFYDKVGALRDVGQNHLLQMLALVTMEPPRFLDADGIREQRAALLKTLRPATPMHTFRAQYEGYQAIPGVQPDSQTETYFAVETFLDHPRWQGVPCRLEGGKRLGRARKEIEILFRHPAPCLCPAEGEHQRNRLLITLDPHEDITVELWSKKPGYGWETEKRSLDFRLRDASQRVQYTEEYEKVMLDAIEGDQTLFVSTEELRAMWAFIDPILKDWQENQVTLETYPVDTETVAAEAEEKLKEE